MNKYKSLIAFYSLFFASSLSMADSFNAFGVSLGTPAALNFVVKTDKLGVPLKLSGAYWGDRLSGIEVGYSFYHNQTNFFSSVQAIAGYSDQRRDESDPKRWKYAGVSVTFRKGGFFVEPGLTAGSGDYSNPQVTAQIGWLWGQ